MNFKSIFTLIFGVATFVAPGIAQADIVVGIAGPLTGGIALNGEQQDLGAQRAIADLNEAGGILGEEITFISVDDACDVDQAVAAAKRLVAAKVDMVIGHLCSRTSIAASEIYDEAGMIMISAASTNPAVTDRGLPMVFRTVGRDDDQAGVAGAFILDRFADRKIALLHDGNTYGKGLVEGVKAELNAGGMTEVMFGQIAPDQESYVSVVDDVAATGADLIYAVSNAVSDVSLLTRQLKEAIPSAVVISADAMASDGFPLLAGDAAQGTLFTFGPDSRKAPEAVDVVARFRDEDGYEPDGYTLLAYAAVQAWAGAVEKAGSTSPADVAKELKSGTFDTVIGNIGFNDKGDVTGVDNFVMYVWGEDGYSELR